MDTQCVRGLNVRHMPIAIDSSGVIDEVSVSSQNCLHGGEAQDQRHAVTLSDAWRLHKEFEDGVYWELTDGIAKGTSMSSYNPELELFMRLQSDLGSSRYALAKALHTPDAQQMAMQIAENLLRVKDEALAAMERHMSLPIKIHQISLLDRVMALADSAHDSCTAAMSRIFSSSVEHADG